MYVPGTADAVCMGTKAKAAEGLRERSRRRIPGRGVFYWEPQCLPGGYKLGAFDSTGTPTAIMDGFIEEK